MLLRQHKKLENGPFGTVRSDVGDDGDDGALVCFASQVLIGGANCSLRLYRIECLAGSQGTIAEAVDFYRKFGPAGGAVTRVTKLKVMTNAGPT